MKRCLGIASAFLLSGVAAFAQQYNIFTLAGGSPPPSNPVAVNAPIGSPGAMTSDVTGNAYFISTDSVYRVDLNGGLALLAGTSRLGFSGDGGQATAAQLNNPQGLAVDSSGSIYIADSGNNRIRKITTGGSTITTFAGNGTAAYSGDGGQASAAALNNPQGLAIDIAGNLYVADTGNNVVRKIVLATGVITTVAGTGAPGYSGDGFVATGAQLNAPVGVAVDTAGNVYIGDSNNNRVRAVKNTIISTVAGNGIPGSSPDGLLATSAQLNHPTYVAVDSSGQLYITDFNNQRVRKILPNQVMVTAASSSVGGVATPTGIAVDPNGNLFVADSTSAVIIRISPSGGITIIAGNRIHFYQGDGGPATSAQLVQPEGMAVDGTGIYIADRAAGLIRKVAPNGTISSPGSATGPAGVTTLGGNIYIADAAGNRVLEVVSGGTGTIVIAGTGTAGSLGDNGSAFTSQLNQPSGVALDTAGNIYIADTGNNRVRKIAAATGIITAFAGNGAPGFSGDNSQAIFAQLNQPVGVVVDSAGNVYVADTGNNRIRKVAPTGVITTVAGNGTQSTSPGDGGPATNAAIASPHGVAVDSLGNLYVTDFNARVRKVATNGIITTIAGNGTAGYSGDNGPALNAQLSQPWGITVDGNGGVYVSDIGELAVRGLAPVASSPLSIVTQSPLPAGTVGTPYSQALVATGGTPPYTWSLSFGSLPPGLTLSPSGSITGTPSATGTYLVTVQVVDSASVTMSVTLGIAIGSSTPTGLTITTAPTLVSGAVGANYSTTLFATAGTPPYQWTLVSGALPPGLGLSINGVISGTPTTAGTYNFVVRVTDNQFASATQSFTLTVVSVGTLSRTGAFAHIAAGGTWTTRVYLTNISSAPVSFNLQFHADDGSALNIPMTVTQQSSVQQIVTPSLTGVINPNTTLIVDTGAQIANTVTGWIDVLTSGPLTGFAIFRTASNGTASEGTTPLQTVFESKMDVFYDDTGSFVTGVAVANLSTNTATITATISDVNGVQLGTQSITLPANGHTSFLFPSQFAVTTNQQGLVQFQSSTGGALAGVGLRANTATGTFTSVPVILP